MNTVRQKIYNILRGSEKYTQTDMVYLASGGFWLTAGNIVSAGAGFLLTIALANLLPKETYGTYKYVLSIISILAISNLAGMENSLTRSIARGFDGSVSEAFRVKIKWGFIGSLAALGLAAYYYLQGNQILSYCLLIAAVFIPFFDPLLIYYGVLGGKKLFKLNAKYTIITQLFSAAAMIITLFLTKNIIAIIAAYFATNSLIRYIIHRSVFKNIELNDKKEEGTIAFGKHLSLMNILGMIAGQIDKIILWHFLGAAQLAIYSFSLAPVNQIKNLLKTIPYLSLPKLAEHEKEEIKKTLPKKLVKFFLVLLVIVAAYIIIAPYFFQIFFPQYSESIQYSRFYALVLLLFPQKLLGAALTAHKQTRALYILQTTTPLISIIAMALLIPLYGIYGAIATLILPLLVNTFTVYYFFKKM